MKTVLFTGATGGLGMACVTMLASRGWTVFAIGTNKEKLKALGNISNVIPICADVTDSVSMSAARDLVLQKTDRLDAIANFAGISSFSSLIEGDPITLSERMLDINVMGTVRTNALFIDLIERGHGRIVNCSSSAGWMTAQPFAGAYTMSKRAVEGYSDSLRRELMFLNIPVIKLQPGSFRTEMTDKTNGDYDRALLQTTHYRRVLTTMKPLMDLTLGHSGNPERLAKTVVQALEAERPKQNYRIGTGMVLAMLEILPEAWVDALYKVLPKIKQSPLVRSQAL